MNKFPVERETIKNVIYKSVRNIEKFRAVFSSLPDSTKGAG